MKEFAGVYYGEGALDLEHRQVHPRNRDLNKEWKTKYTMESCQ